MIAGVKTGNKTINELVAIPFVGDVFLFVLIFIPPVLISFALQATLAPLQNSLGFGKAMIFALPLWNLLLWFCKLKLYVFFVPAWLLLGGIATYRGVVLFSGEKPGKKLPYANEASVYENLYKKTTFDGQRIALEGYIQIKDWKPDSDGNYCELTDGGGNYLLRMFVKQKSKNSLDIKPLNTAKKSNAGEVEIDTANSFMLDNEGSKISLGQKILLSFEIEYFKTRSGEYPPSTYSVSPFNSDFQKVAKAGDKYYAFSVKDIRIDTAK